MNKESISVTDAARNFADCVNRAHYQNTTFVLLRNGTPVARLIPEPEKDCTGRALADLLAGVQLTEAESKSWRRDLHEARKSLKQPVDKWR